MRTSKQQHVLVTAVAFLTLPPRVLQPASEHFLEVFERSAPQWKRICVILLHIISLSTWAVCICVTWGNCCSRGYRLLWQLFNSPTALTSWESTASLRAVKICPIRPNLVLQPSCPFKFCSEIQCLNSQEIILSATLRGRDHPINVGVKLQEERLRLRDVLTHCVQEKAISVFRLCRNKSCNIYWLSICIYIIYGKCLGFARKLNYRWKTGDFSIINFRDKCKDHHHHHHQHQHQHQHQHEWCSKWN